MLGFTFSVVHPMGFHRCVMTYIYPEYRTERCHCPHITLRSTYSSLPASSTPQATTDLFYCIYSFPRYSYSYHTWNCIYCTTLVWQAGVSGGLPWTQGPCWAVPHPGAQCLTRLPAVPLLTQHHPGSLREPWPAVPSASDQAFLPQKYHLPKIPSSWWGTGDSEEGQAPHKNWGLCQPCLSPGFPGRSWIWSPDTAANAGPGFGPLYHLTLILCPCLSACLSGSLLSVGIFLRSSSLQAWADSQSAPYYYP